MTHQDVALHDGPARVEHTHDDPDADTPATVAQKGRKLVLFADGTGNAFTTQESSVWRLYEALDHTQPDQIAYYIKGVGTAGWAPLAALDGATGIGVPANVRKLYRFLCWNWREGDEIYIFGFSRGAFTARTLAALIASQGLVPAVIDKVAVSHAEMQRNTMAAWRKYREESVGYYSLPTIWLARWLRNVVIYLYHFLLRHRSYASVREAMDGRKEVKIEFLGLFDTVEAFGVPVEELRVAIDWAIWPISFRNYRLSDKVKHACHALALDDERTTFHPLRIDQANLAEGQIVKEVWFAGVHSDIGGGYPESTLSFVPLVWMAEQLRDQLRFQDGTIEHFREYQSAIGPMHDSRSGAGVLYRYGPRPIHDRIEDGGPPVVHFGVVERMLHGCDNYAPLMLPANARVLLPDDQVLPLTRDETRKAMRSAYAKRQGDRHKAAEADAFMAMSPPNSEMVRQVLDTVWWRRVAYFSLVIALIIFAAWPWIARTVVGSSKAHGLENTTLLKVITAIDNGTSTVIKPFADLVSSVLPSYVAPWLAIALYYPTLTTVLVIIILIAWNRNATLRDSIQERARLAWYRPDRMASRKRVSKSGWLLAIGRWMRLHAWPVRMAFTNVLMPAVFLAAIFGSGLLLLSRGYFDWRAGVGDFCKSSASTQAVGDTPVTARDGELFDVGDFCWPSRLAVEKGRKYRVWIQMADPWFDRTIMTGLNGFTTPPDLTHRLAVPILRLRGADWFQPVVRIGARGSYDLPLQAINGVPASELPRRVNATVPAYDDDSKDNYPIHVEDSAEFKQPGSELSRVWKPFGDFEPIPDAALPAARALWRKQGLSELLVAEFEAPEAGELFFYVNDAVQIFPRLMTTRHAPRWLVPVQGRRVQFYKNNSGTATIRVQRLPAPPPP
ncbi:DUF2235 domain-containing protein [Bradyrhizobium arachidis]|uniref:DUF2235 domain-containing protein n=1 Tax=Bradyrhizobium TaxID=374 RepID=UPI0021615B7D|nr:MULTISPECIES: DUF2235 domain-containing protein [Bradyrhizobium]MDN4986913.1 DUF2235 domain-containing protein [Bradyrhizobium sp. WYCCWR 13022]UVO37699.1 DUF2235 domain-containing protein [Bradyrhizobium arachidis]